MLFGAYAIQGFGCGGDDSNGGPGPSDASGDRGAGGSTGTAGSTGSGGTTPLSDAATSLGTACTADTDCGGGLTCSKVTDNPDPATPGGWPNGVCTRTCTDAGSECADLGGICLLFTATTGVCSERCMAGELAAGAIKCHNRRDEICIRSSENPALVACFALCSSDSDCGTRKCDVAGGLCVDTAPMGQPIGASCMMDSECQGGFCIPLTDSDAAASPGVCSAPCRLGNRDACGFVTGKSLDSGVVQGACLFGPDTAGIGDLGACAQLCDTNADCKLTYPNWSCIQDATVKGIFGHGYCALQTPDAAL